MGAGSVLSIRRQRLVLALRFFMVCGSRTGLFCIGAFLRRTRLWFFAFCISYRSLVPTVMRFYLRSLCWFSFSFFPLRGCTGPLPAPLLYLFLLAFMPLVLFTISSLWVGQAVLAIAALPQCWFFYATIARRLRRRRVCACACRLRYAHSSDNGVWFYTWCFTPPLPHTCAVFSARRSNRRLPWTVWRVWVGLSSLRLYL